MVTAIVVMVGVLVWFNESARTKQLAEELSLQIQPNDNAEVISNNNPANQYNSPAIDCTYAREQHKKLTPRYFEPEILNTQDSTTIGWKTYINNKYGFSFKYPADWTMNDKLSPDELTIGAILWLQSPQTKELLLEGKKDWGYQFDLSLSFINNINDKYSPFGDGVCVKYNNLENAFSYNIPLLTKIGEVVVNGVKGYEVIMGGAGSAYGVMFEHSGVYLLGFDTAGNKSAMSPEQKTILSTFKFIN